MDISNPEVCLREDCPVSESLREEAQSRAGMKKLRVTLNLSPQT